MASLFGCLMPHDFQALGCQSSLGRNQLVPIDTWTSYSTPFSSCVRHPKTCHFFGIYRHSLWVGFVGNSLTLLQRQPFEDTFVDYFLLGAWGSGRQRSLCLLAFL